jgi:hypothetical protein
MRTRCFAAAALLLGGASASAQDFVLMPDSTSDKIVLFDYSNGALVNANFILDSAGVLYDFSTPKDAFQVGNEIWVIDQVSDQVVRFDLQGNHIATLLPGVAMIDNARGGCFANGTVYVSNDGSGNGATADSLIMFDSAGNRLGATTVTNSGSSPFDVEAYNGELLVTHFTAANNTARYDYAVSLLGIFHASTGVGDVNNAEQVSIRSNGNVIVAGFSSPAGIYEYSPAGTLVSTYSVGSGLRGVIELGNGNLMFTDSAGAKVYDVVLQTTTTVHASTGCQFLNKLSIGPSGPVTYCTAGVSTNGCQASITADNDPSVSQANPCNLSVANVEGQKSGLIFYGLTQAAMPWATGSTSFLCVKAPTQRTPTQSSNGTAGLCDGALTLDLNAYLTGNPGSLGQPFAAGNKIYAQAWYRDPPAPKTTNLSDGVELTFQP